MGNANSDACKRSVREIGGQVGYVGHVGWENTGLGGKSATVGCKERLIDTGGRFATGACMPDDDRWLRHTFQLAEVAVRAGDYAFGACLVAADDTLLVEAMQTVETSRRWLEHAEMNVLTEASRRWTREQLAGCTLYSSTEPCPMCTGAIGWSVNRLVFGLSQAAMYRLWPGRPRFVEPWNCRLLLDRVEPPMEVLGPLLEGEASRAHTLALERWQVTKGATRTRRPGLLPAFSFWLR